MGKSKIEFKIKRILYPKTGVLELGSYSIIACELVNLIEGDEIVLNKTYKNFSLISYTPALFNEFETYIGEVEPEEGKFGISYRLLNLEREQAEITDNEKMAFIDAVFTPIQKQNLIEAYGIKAYDLIAEKNTPQLLQVKGIGEKTIEYIYRKFDNNLKYQKIIFELSQYNLTQAMMDSLLEKYKDPEIVIKKVKDNIYTLASEISGIGFKRCDYYALQSGVSPISQDRIEAYLQYLLYQQAESGNSWVAPQPLLNSISINLGVEVPHEIIKNALHNLRDQKILWWNEEKTQMGLYYYRKLEEEIAENIFRINNNSHHPYVRNLELEKRIIEKTEKELGFSLTDEQINAINGILENKVSILTAYGGCVDKDTEFFNGKCWKPISKYMLGDKVLQFDTQTKEANLVYPLRYIKEPCDKMYHFKTKYGVDQCLSPEHRVLFCKHLPSGIIHELTAEEVKNQHLSSEKGFLGKIPTVFKYSGSGIDLSDAEIKLMCAVICDGAFSKSNTNFCRLHIKKERKKTRIREILRECGLTYKEKVSAAEGYSDFYFYAPRKEKEFGEDWYNCTNEQLKIICDNILFWDGNISATKNGKIRRNFSTTIKNTADFVQFAFSACGYKSCILIADRRGRERRINGKSYITNSIDYNVSISERKYAGIGGYPVYSRAKNEAIKEIIPEDKLKYCFTVPTGALVLRRNGRIFITGNCGKTVLTKVLGEIYKAQGFTPCFCTLSGKAAARIFEATGFQGATIHKTLGYNPQTNDFTLNRANPLGASIIIVDEASFLGGELFKSLLEAIPDEARLVLVGDDKQLPPIGACNIFFDMINSGKIKVNRLSKIHRQAQKSGIILASKSVREGTQIAPKGWIGKKIIGELKDFELDIYQDRLISRPKLLDYYKSRVRTLEDAANTQIILATKTKGDVNTFDINNVIQEYLNPRTPNKNEILLKRNDKEFYLREGDRIINRKNDYKAIIYNPTTYESTTEVFNGFCGIIQKIIGKKVVVKFEMNEYPIMFTYDKLKNLELSYALTVHLYQGSQIDNIIYLIDNTSYIMNTRELIYTALTRAKKHCIFLAQEEALRHAINTPQTVNKHTFLRALLKNA